MGSPLGAELYLFVLQSFLYLRFWGLLLACSGLVGDTVQIDQIQCVPSHRRVPEAYITQYRIYKDFLVHISTAECKNVHFWQCRSPCTG